MLRYIFRLGMCICDSVSISGLRFTFQRELTAPGGHVPKSCVCGCARVWVLMVMSNRPGKGRIVTIHNHRTWRGERERARD